MKNNLSDVLKDCALNENVKQVINEAWDQKISEIKEEIRKEEFERMSKKYEFDKANMVSATQTALNEAVKKESDAIKTHVKKLVQERIALKEAKEGLKKELLDKEQALKESYNEKLNAIVKKLLESKNAEVSDHKAKLNAFYKEMNQKQIDESIADKKKLAESLRIFRNFIVENAKSYARKANEEYKSLDALKVNLIKENNNKLAESKKQFFESAAKKVHAFLKESIKKETVAYRKEIAEARKAKAGMMMFEAVQNAYANMFFNKDKAVKSLLKSVQEKQNAIIAENKALKEAKEELAKKNEQLLEQKSRYSREKIINESIKNLNPSQQEMIRTIVKDTKTEVLSETIQRLIPSVLGSSKKVEKPTRILKENARPRMVTGNKPENSNVVDAELKAALDSLHA